MNGWTLKAVYVTIALALVAGGTGWGTLKAQTGSTAEKTRENAAQIQAITKEIQGLTSQQSVINTRTQRIEDEQALIREDIKELLRRTPPSRGDRE